MRSMPQALLWETFSRGRWSLPGMFLLAIMLPLLVYGALSGMPLDPGSREFIVLQAAFMPIVIFQLAIGVHMAQGPHSRLYELPISANSIVAWHMFSGALILSAQTAAAAWLINALFHVNWPIVGPALFAAAAWSTLKVLVCVSCHQSLPGICVAGAPGILMGWWLLTRFNPDGVFKFPAPPTRFWSEVTPAEVATLLGAFCICYVMTTYGVNFARCGERMPTLGFGTWLSNRLDAWAKSRKNPPPFRSAAHAQLWYEWQKGIAFPLVTFFLLLIAVIGGLASLYMQATNLFSLYEVVLVFGGFISIFLAVPVGIYLGIEVDTKSVGQRETQLGDSIDQMPLESAMGSFLGSRPITCWAFAKTTLRIAALSSLMAWLMWFVVFAGCLLIMWLTGQIPPSLLPKNTGFLYLPTIILGSWIATANLSTIGLSGRGTKILFSIVVILVGYAVLMGIIQHFTSAVVVANIHTICITIGSVLIFIAGIWAYVQAQHQRHLTSRALIIAFLATCSLVTAGVLLLPAGCDFIAYPMIIAFAVLVVLPFASMPLAIAWNRHRG